MPNLNEHQIGAVVTPDMPVQYFLEGYSVADTAKLLHMSEGLVETCLREHLRVQMESAR